MKEISISSKTYDEAINKAIIELETTSENLDINIIQEGSEGFLGIFGSKPWVIQFKVKDVSENIRDIKNDDKVEVIEKEEKITEEKNDNIKEEKNIEDIINISNKFLIDIFNIFGIKINIENKYDEKDNCLNITLNSEDDMGLIIGKRGQTLDSIQYLLSLVINKDFEEYIRVKLDTENYRDKRKEKLEVFAKNISKKVKKTKKAVVLEPMNPYERRIIHSVLQNDSEVTTKSEGEEPFRHIVVIPKHNTKNKRGYRRKKENN